MKTRRLVTLALMTAVSLIVWVIEAQIPAPLPVPGIKLGLANVITLAVMALFGRRDALLVLLARVVLGSLFAGSFSSIVFSLCGGLLAWGVMAVVIGLFPRGRLWVVSVLGALAHNAGQLLAAMAVTRTAALVSYAPALAAAAIITGTFTGLACQGLVRALEKHGILK